jgi:hypothetical protein
MIHEMTFSIERRRFPFTESGFRKRFMAAISACQNLSAKCHWHFELSNCRAVRDGIGKL